MLVLKQASSARALQDGTLCWIHFCLSVCVRGSKTNHVGSLERTPSLVSMLLIMAVAISGETRASVNPQRAAVLLHVLVQRRSLAVYR